MKDKTQQSENTQLAYTPPNRIVLRIEPFMTMVCRAVKVLLEGVCPAEREGGADIVMRGLKTPKPVYLQIQFSPNTSLSSNQTAQYQFIFKSNSPIQVYLQIKHPNTS